MTDGYCLLCICKLLAQRHYKEYYKSLAVSQIRGAMVTHCCLFRYYLLLTLCRYLRAICIANCKPTERGEQLSPIAFRYHYYLFLTTVNMHKLRATRNSRIGPHIICGRIAVMTSVSYLYANYSLASIMTY